ncbi:MAG: MFS transporter [Pseudomonadota bacterium]
MSSKMAASSGAAAARKSRVTPKTVFACAIGNILEWYDFTAYGFLATIIGASFFPSGDSFASVLAAFGALAAGYGARPLGSIIGGHLGDRIGRKPTMILCMASINISTFLLGLLPTYEQIGVMAAVLLVAIRLVQGLSVAGEYSSSSVLLVENAEPRRRGFVGTWIACAMMAGCLLGSGMAALSSAVVGDEAMKEWGWRIPFLFGGVIAIIGIIIRRRLTESAAMPGEDEILAIPIVSAFRDHWRTIVTIIGINMPISVSYFVLFVYAVSYLTDQMHFTTAQAMDINTVSLIAMTVLIPFTGLAADRFGRKAVLYVSLLGTIVAGWPAWYLMHTPELGLVLVGQMVLACLSAAGWALSVPLMVELLPAKVRCTGGGLGYNICLALFGGTTPLIAAYLVERTGDDFTPIYYIMIAAAIALFFTWRMPEMAGRDLPKD